MCGLCVNSCEGILLSSHLKITLSSQWEKRHVSYSICSEKNKDILNAVSKMEGNQRFRVDAGCMNAQYSIAYCMCCVMENEKEFLLLRIECTSQIIHSKQS